MKYKDIDPLVTGYARMIFYEVHGKDKNGEFSPFVDPKKNRVLTVREGYFENGVQHGFGRMMGDRTEAFVGFYKHGKLHGKAQYYHLG